MTARPLDGVRVLDLTNVLAGPYCTYQLVLMGAEVVKIERPGEGDLARQLGPDSTLNDARLGVSFLAQNAGKRSVELDLKNPDDRDRFLRLVGEADVLVENFRPGVLRRLGLDWEALRPVNPRLVYCAISGFGQTGPLSQRPAYDQIVQGMSGMMSVTGTPETAPLRVGFPVADTVGGLLAAFAVTAALTGRERTGEGAYLDVSMLEAAISAMGWAVSNYLGAGVEPVPMGDQNFTAAPSGTFMAADGPLNIAANRQEQFETLCELIGRTDLVTDERFHSRDIRKRNRDQLNVEINAGLLARSAQEWEALLSERGVPAARVLTVPQALRLDHLRDRGFLHHVPFPGQPDARLTVMGNGVRVDGEAYGPPGPPPLLGEHNDDRIETVWGALPEGAR
ncbi:CaiB/BaiF CoA transferase family protein [Polymorphospora rubra]|uniref:CoA transferase n=1 Tax=Polymorphospora rubra TaxID=338584 RepID=A0A810N9G1_9ACTN|nr:CoA transferase [Polymorphospora rubra]BCJ68448.1 CoA transferase [Polymorphospora rubra]